MKAIILAALLGAMTVDDVNALRVTEESPASGISEHAKAVAVNAGVKFKFEGVKEDIKKQAPAEQAESLKIESEGAKLSQEIEARIQAESQKTFDRKQKFENRKEEREAALHKKLTEITKARQEVNEDIHQANLEAAAEGRLADDVRHRKLLEERKFAIASIEAETARLDEIDRKKGQAAATARRNMTDEDYIANLPERHLEGYVAVDDDVEDEDSGADDEGEDDKDLIGVEDDDMYADEDAAADANNEEDNVDEGEEMNESGEEDDGEAEQAQEPQQPMSLAEKKPSTHLHKTSIRVDPPLTTDGKKSITESEKQLDDATKDYDKLKDKAQDYEFKFKSAARISRHAREQKGEAEDAYYISAKNQRKAARHAENLAREAQRAAAKQAAHDKYNEVISNANTAASASKPAAAPAAKTAPAAKAQAEKPATPAKAPAASKSLAQE